MPPTDPTRRTFLRGLLARAPTLAWPAWMPRLAFAAADPTPTGDVLVVIFLRGGADALNMIVPHGEDAYYRARPTLGVPRPDDGRAARGKRAVDLDGFFGLHPALGSLHEAWQAGHLAVVHACGAPDESRSHFRAMELIERGVTSTAGPASGWIGRHLATKITDNHSPLRAIGLGETVPRSLHGTIPATALRSILEAHISSDVEAASRMQRLLRRLYPRSSTPRNPAQRQLLEVGRETLDVIAVLEQLDPARYRPSGGARYPDSELGYGLQQIAMLIKAQVGLEVAAIDSGGWDTHFVQGGSEGLMAGLLADLGQGLAALHADLSDVHESLTVVVISEFGRRVAENASLGTDHGHGGAMLVLGGNVVGGVHGDWPGLHPDQRVGPGDLAVTTDYRDVLAEICLQRLGNPALAEIFPDYRPTFRGIVRPHPAFGATSFSQRPPRWRPAPG